MFYRFLIAFNSLSAVANTAAFIFAKHYWWSLLAGVVSAACAAWCVMEYRVEQSMRRETEHCR